MLGNWGKWRGRKKERGANKKREKKDEATRCRESDNSKRSVCTCGRLSSSLGSANDVETEGSSAPQTTHHPRSFRACRAIREPSLPSNPKT